MRSDWRDSLIKTFMEHGVQQLPKPLWEFEPLEDYKSCCFDLAIVDTCRNFAVCVVSPNKELVYVGRYRLSMGSIISADPDIVMEKAIKEMQEMAHKHIMEHILVDRILLED